jgi:hypothetical protein
MLAMLVTLTFVIGGITPQFTGVVRLPMTDLSNPLRPRTNQVVPNVSGIEGHQSFPDLCLIGGAVTLEQVTSHLAASQRIWGRTFGHSLRGKLFRLTSRARSHLPRLGADPEIA